MNVLSAGAAVFVIGCIVASFYYPGGTQLDPETIAYSWQSNFLSDLGCSVAWSGASNARSCVLFNGAVFVFGFSLRYWLRRHRLQMKSSLLFYGLYMHSLSLMGLALSPFNLLPMLHHVCVAVWIASAVLSMLVAFYKFDHPLLKAFVLVLVLLALISVLLLMQDPSKHAMTVQQKLFTALNCLWLVFLGHLFTLKQTNQDYAEQSPESQT